MRNRVAGSDSTATITNKQSNIIEQLQFPAHNTCRACLDPPVLLMLIWFTDLASRSTTSLEMT